MPVKSQSMPRTSPRRVLCPGAVRGSMPAAQAPQLCSLADNPPSGPEWISEIKFDGYRLLAVVEDGAVRLLTRNGHDWADRMPAVCNAVRALGLRSALLDGELVALRPDGVSSFPMLQTALKASRDDTLVFYAFDLLHLDGWDLRGSTLLDRKHLLAAAVPWGGMVRYSDHHTGQADELRRNACRMRLEGIICKRSDALCRPGRSGDWLKVKCLGREEMIVLGWTPPAGTRVGIGALQMGYRDAAGELHYAGAVGTGFSAKELVGLRRQLDAIAATPPLGLLYAGEPIDPGTSWVRPELVAEVKYTGWSGAGRVRHGVYLGLREDKAVADVIRELADPDAPRLSFHGKSSDKAVQATGKRWHGAVPPRRAAALASTSSSRLVGKACRR